jgi:hypothetical protein
MQNPVCIRLRLAQGRANENQARHALDFRERRKVTPFRSDLQKAMDGLLHQAVEAQP